MDSSGTIRWQQRLDTFGTALAQLTDACSRERYEDFERAGLIKTFEFCFELSWKALRDLPLFEGYEVKFPRRIFRASFDAKLIHESDCETLIDALDSRNLMSHAYQRDEALRAEKRIKRDYYPVLLRLHAKLEERCKAIRTKALDALESLGINLHGDQSRVLPHVVNFSIPDLDSEAVMLALKGVAAISNGSACTSESYKPSHVLSAMGLEPEQIAGALRISWSHLTPDVDWSVVASCIKRVL